MSQGPEQHGMWLSILQWSLKQSDGTSPSARKPLSDEDKSFLMKAFSELTKDEPKRLSEILKKIQEIISSELVSVSSSFFRSFHSFSKLVMLLMML
jgi:hypothetical protein